MSAPLTLDAPHRRSSDIPVWFRVLKELGLPTLYAVALLFVLVRWVDGERVDRRELLSRLATSIEAQTVALQGLAAEERAHADAVRLTWPRVRLPAPPRGTP